jgi:uncharacterized membrane protein SirB2
MEQYIPQFHIAMAIASLIIYIIRGVMMLAGNTQSRLMMGLASLTILLLFGSGVYLGFVNKLSFADGFVGTLIIGLLLYVGFGVIALKQGLSKPVASILWVLGLLAFIYAYLIATQKINPFF